MLRTTLISATGPDMEVRVLGSSGSRIPGQQTSCMLINDRILLDAGGVTGALPIEEQVKIDHILLTHAHLDHVFDLAFLADNVMALRQAPLHVWAPAPVLAAVRAHLFNDAIWPDLSRVEMNGFQVISFHPLSEGAVARVGELEVGWAKTEHTVFSAGYLLTQADVAVLFTGDTTTTQAIWDLANSSPRLAAIFVETSFPNRLENLARETGHLTPALLAEELKKLDNSELPVKIFHMKSQYLEEIRSDFERFCARCEILNGSERFRF